MSGFVGEVCPFCKTKLKEGDNVKICGACGIAHHQECWDENKGCSTFGCSEHHGGSQATNGAYFCANCGTALSDEQAFCPKCGTPKKVPLSNVCAKCGNEVEEGHEFCPKCGQKVGLGIEQSTLCAINKLNESISKKKKKTKAMPIILAVVIAILGIVGFVVFNTIQQHNKAKAIADYIDNATIFSSEVLSSCAKLETVGNKIQSCWHDYIYDDYTDYYSIEDAVDYAQTDQAANISTVKASDSTISTLYAYATKVPDAKNTDLADIKDAVKELYASYTQFYNCVLNVTGNYTTFTSNFADCDTDFSQKFNSLNSLLKAYN